ncbi:MAG: type II toxin-antitoxin system RelE/ParE family toxin [Candidatus Anammoxibacter sp.]
MIKNIAHKGLKKIFEKGNISSVQPSHVKKIRLILGLLDNAKVIGDVNFPGSDLHRLKGDKKGLWSVHVSGNWCITFRFEDGDIFVDKLELSKNGLANSLILSASTHCYPRRG